MVGRVEEQRILKLCHDSGRSEFVALYGRRRVGKTFLVKEMFGGDFAFYATGILDGESSAAVQLENFNAEIANYGGADLPPAANWREAFVNLNKLIERAPKGRKKVVFLDEVPWMATPNSGFLAALDYFWNRWASSRKDVLLIVCGSASSWIVENIIDNTGGLHNRLTRQIALPPFTLAECEVYCRELGHAMTRYQMTEAYMIFGGIPYYLSLMDPKFDLYQNIDRMYFVKNAPLRDEYENLFRALFRNSENYIRIVEALATKVRGLTRDEIVRETGLSDGGSVTKCLKNLEQSGFLRAYLAFGKKSKDRMYQLVDGFTLFHIRFHEGRASWEEDFWIKYSATPAHKAWSGYAFEQVCLLHLPQIKRKLGISGVLTAAYSWRSQTSDQGAQIDLVLDRSDRVINLCEIKFSSYEYEIDKSYSARLRERASAFISETKTRKAVRTTFITTYGLKRNAYAAEYPAEVVMEDLFEQ
ncbi:MAG: AAA family ATPase [Clostridiales Family XIII bacterium]|jgi:AAA+ ATPase superfamily predicted ATPase|nr:AAA family ATPase [Clostridiales Family XIII bacterium]